MCVLRPYVFDKGSVVGLLEGTCCCPSIGKLHVLKNNLVCVKCRFTELPQQVCCVTWKLAFHNTCEGVDTCGSSIPVWEIPLPARLFQTAGAVVSFPSEADDHST